MVAIRLSDIRSLTEFQRRSRESIRRLKRTGRPEVLTVNGQAELVVQDARAYQKLLDRAADAQASQRLDRSIASYRAGRVRGLDDVLDTLEARRLGKHSGSAKRRKA
jgi:PHD/YefM family antitoxin component YafN of YafNO toxin-antitoxin module